MTERFADHPGIVSPEIGNVSCQHWHLEFESSF